MSKFKVGDRVRFTEDNPNGGAEFGTKGQEITLVGVNSHPGINQYEFQLEPEGLKFGAPGECLEKVIPRSSELGLISVTLTDETVLAAVAIAVSKIFKEDVKIESLTGLQHYRDPGELMPANPDKWEAKLVKQS